MVRKRVVPAWSEHEKLSYEKESLGFYVSGHPLDAYAAIFAANKYPSISSLKELPDRAPIKVAAPCEGTGYEIGSMSIVKGARNLENAKKWYDWALTAPAQEIGAQIKNYQVPANKSARVPEEAPKLTEIRLIDFDFAKYGSSSERRRLLSKWDSEVKNLPK